ncbi:hypothetical protein [Aquimarina sp. RZ0]|uniref:hypothetical protein n=1 Tax=Aquimarina sp. RZ0 TaxID=2607730 RepID=UPI0011F2B320|nr:hypothetical protein [Aquimarina sp. RZ0]KAA1241558.1 hypothetical protein F0000_26450 [Aquimarina sp. RZ0]
MKTINFFAKSILSISALLSVYSCEKDDLSTLNEESNPIEIETIQKSNRAILARDTFLNPSGSNSGVWFKASTQVTFETGQNRKVKTGTLRSNTFLNPSGSNSGVWFKASTQIIFATGQNRKVRTGTLRSRTFLRISGSNVRQWFAAGSIITFDNNGGVS